MFSGEVPHSACQGERNAGVRFSGRNDIGQNGNTQYFSKEETGINLFAQIKAAVSVKEAAEHYGLRVLPNGMACCPFHDDHNPSLKLNEDYFFCFGCNAHGDVIDFTARLWGLSAQETVEKLRGDFGIKTGQMPIPFPAFPAAAPNLEQLCICVLKEYLRLLRIWRLRYAPVTLGCNLDDRFVESLQMEPVINFFLDSLIAGDSALRERVLQVFRKDGTIYELRDYVERKSKEDICHYQEEKIA